MTRFTIFDRKMGYVTRFLPENGEIYSGSVGGWGDLPHFYQQMGQFITFLSANGIMNRVSISKWDDLPCFYPKMGSFKIIYNDSK